MQNNYEFLSKVDVVTDIGNRFFVSLRKAKPHEAIRQKALADSKGPSG
jgi:hypothetical protein